MQASDNKIGTVVDQVLLFCFHYDPSEGKYGAAIMNLVRLGGVLTLLALGGLVLVLFRRKRIAAAACRHRAARTRSDPG